MKDIRKLAEQFTYEISELIDARLDERENPSPIPEWAGFGDRTRVQRAEDSITELLISALS